jgi:hypothetical protein
VFKRELATKDSLVALAQEMGADGQKLSECIDSGKFAQKVQ